MIELTKSSRIAYESLNDTDKKFFTGLYDTEKKAPDMLLKSFNAKQLPEIDNTYILKISNKLRAIVQISNGKTTILEIVTHNNLQNIFSPPVTQEMSL